MKENLKKSCKDNKSYNNKRDKFNFSIKGTLKGTFQEERIDTLFDYFSSLSNITKSN